ncbi:acyltransferase family protein [Acuticoccus sp. I52.16.1]|uniref:acyltransferase family protein n=1 Tax=Acuticoccus sp. I52.16.1 TaxID=2928472 RepID=UPI001FD2DB2A|nr:acyltransferase family protein [Acuticoccus sp. I52.16.1]UOM33090.1 acyltransferase family protein [Acuticoccus sp. I52.16.1]
MAASERIVWLDVAKGTSILLVVLLHATLYMRQYDLASYGYEQLNNLFAPIRMPLFFAVSGLLGTRAVTRSLSDLMSRRIVTFAYLFTLWTLVRWAYFGTVQTNVVTPQEGSSYAELLVAWVRPNTGIWFIWALAIFFLLAKLLYPVRHAAFPLAVALALLAFGDVIAIEAFSQRNLVWYAPFFLGGAWYGPAILGAVTARPLVVGIVGGAVFASLSVAVAYLEGIAFGAGRLAMSVAGLALGSAVSILLAAVLPARAVLTYLGRNTLPIYVAHVMIVAALALVLADHAAQVPMVRYWGVPVIVAAAVALSLALKLVVERVGLAWAYAPPRWPARQAAALGAA